jgi:hypothetical protein
MANLKMSPEKAILLINERIDAISVIEKNQYGLEYYDFIRWCSKTWAAIDAIYEVDDPPPKKSGVSGSRIVPVILT